jgi:hypothetical protein
MDTSATYIDVQFQGPDSVEGGKTRLYYRVMSGRFYDVPATEMQEATQQFAGETETRKGEATYNASLTEEEFREKCAALAAFLSEDLGVPLRPDWAA